MSGSDLTIEEKLAFLKVSPPIDGWRRYTKPGTSEVHVAPRGGDRLHHRYSTGCSCQPLVIAHRGDVAVIHTAVDGRPGPFPQEKNVSDNYHMTGIIDITRELIGKQDTSPEYRRALRDVLIEHLQVDDRTAGDLINGTQTPTDEHVVLVAFHMVGPKTMKEAQEELMDLLPDETDATNRLESWWIAMDERYQGSDNDSAVFVKGSGPSAWSRYKVHELDSDPVLRQIRECTFSTRTEAETVVYRMNDLIRKYRYVTYNDVLDILLIRGRRNHQGRRFGWDRHIDVQAAVQRIKYQPGWKLVLPQAHYLTVT